MTDHQTARNMLPGATSPGSPAPPPTPDAPAHNVRNRLLARILGTRLDRQIDHGATLRAGTALAAHAARITSIDEREHLARSLRRALQLAREPERRPAAHLPVHREATLANSDLIDEVVSRLHTPLSVKPRGMARLRLLLADGSGPLYRRTRGTLTAQLRGVLAAL